LGVDAALPRRTPRRIPTTQATLFGECTQVCPAGIPITAVAALNHERLRTWARRYQVRDNARRSKREHPRRGDECGMA